MVTGLKIYFESGKHCVSSVNMISCLPHTDWSSLTRRWSAPSSWSCARCPAAAPPWPLRARQVHLRQRAQRLRDGPAGVMLCCLVCVTGGFLFDGMSDDDDELQYVRLSHETHIDVLTFTCFVHREIMISVFYYCKISFLNYSKGNYYYYTKIFIILLLL